MSIEPCQICGGTGFIKVPVEPGESSPAGVSPNLPPDPSQAGAGQEPQAFEEVPCPSCSGSGVSAGL